MLFASALRDLDTFSAELTGKSTAQVVMVGTALSLMESGRPHAQIPAGAASALGPYVCSNVGQTNWYRLHVSVTMNTHGLRRRPSLSVTIPICPKSTCASSPAADRPSSPSARAGASLALA